MLLGARSLAVALQLQLLRVIARVIIGKKLTDQIR